LSHDLRSSQLQYLAAMKGFCQELRKRQTMPIDCRTDDLPTALPRTFLFASSGLELLRTAIHWMPASVDRAPSDEVFLSRNFLAPVPLMKHPSAPAVNIPGLHPHGAGTWRTDPSPGYPDIPCASPTLISVHPDISGTECNSNDSDSDGRRRRRYANDSLRSSDSSAHQQHGAKSDATKRHCDLLLKRTRSAAD
jgi:hypothetical protein